MVSACPGQFPKTDGCDRLYAEDVNLLYGNFIGMRSTEAETAMNIAKLQYCNSVTDINHDYMVVDVFTDATGYNNTICTADTTSTYCLSACCLLNYYTNVNTPIICGYSYGAVLGAGGTNITGNYCSYTTVAQGHTATSSNCVCVCVRPVLTNVTYFCFQVCYIITWDGSDASTDNCATALTVGWQDDYTLTGIKTNANCLRCYCYTCVSAGCYCFYCNGTGKCQLALTCFPAMCLQTKECTHWASNSGCVKIFGLCYMCASTKLTTNSVTYSAPVKTTYLDYDKYGTGTVVYNVIDSATGNCIACNLLPNCFYELDCCVQCHRYEIIQCSDGVSCIKSYAIVTGVY